MDASKSPRRWLWISLLAVFIVAVLFRSWQISDIPPGLFGDEAADGLDALDVLAGRGKVFFSSNFGREGLHMWIVALSIRLLGIQPLAVRLPSVLAGIGTILATFWLGVELFTNRPQRRAITTWISPAYLIPMAAAIYTATSFWHVHFSRFGIRGIFTTTATALTMAALWRGINRHSWRWFLVAGFFMGVGVHFYTASRFVPLFVGLWAIFWVVLSVLGIRLEERVDSVLHFGVALIAMFAVAALVFAPLAAYFISHPGSFMQRASEVSVFQTETESVIATMMQAAGANLKQLVLPGAGDQSRFYNLPGRAVFDPLTAILSVIGLGICLWRWRNPACSFLVVWLVVMMTPSFLAVDRYPTLPRLLGVIPGIYFFPAVGLIIGLQQVSKMVKARWAPWIMVAGTALALLIHAGVSFRDYYLVWAPAPATADAFETDMTAAWRWLEENNPSGDIYLSSDLYRHPTFMFLREQVPTTRFFSHRNPDLHWFDARSAWPLSANDPATYLLGNSAMPPAFLIEHLGLQLKPIQGGDAYLATGPEQLPTHQYQMSIAPGLQLTNQVLVTPGDEDDQLVIMQIWLIEDSPAVSAERYSIETALISPQGEVLQSGSSPFSYFAPEWQGGDSLLTWQFVPSIDPSTASDTAVRLLRQDGTPLVGSASPEGWVRLPLQLWNR